MHRPHRHLDGEGQQERYEYELLRLHLERRVHPAKEIEASCPQIQVHKGHEHEHRTQEGVQEELQRCIDAPLPAPDADDQEHRHEHEFPEHVEQQPVECGENADHEPFEDEERGKILRRPRFDRGPARDDDEWRDERREQDQRHGNAVNTQVIAGVEGRNPRNFFDELHVRRREIKARPKYRAEQQDEQGSAQRRPAHDAGPPRRATAGVPDEQQRAAAEYRQPDEVAEHVMPVRAH